MKSYISLYLFTFYLYWYLYLYLHAKYWYLYRYLDHWYLLIEYLIQDCLRVQRLAPDTPIYGGKYNNAKEQ